MHYKITDKTKMLILKEPLTEIKLSTRIHLEPKVMMTHSKTNVLIIAKPQGEVLVHLSAEYKLFLGM